MSKNTDDKLTKDIACGYHMQPNMCLSVSGAFPQLTLKSSNLIQVRKSAYARKYHYQPDYGRLYYNRQHSLFRRTATQVFYIRWKQEFVKCSYALQTKIHVNLSVFCRLFVFKIANHIEKKLTYLQKLCITRNSKRYHTESKTNVSCESFKK